MPSWASCTRSSGRRCGRSDRAVQAVLGDIARHRLAHQLDHGLAAAMRSRTAEEETAILPIFSSVTAAAARLRSGAGAASRASEHASRTSPRSSSSRSATASSASPSSRAGSRQPGSVRAVSAPTISVSSASGWLVMDGLQGIHRIGHSPALDLQRATLSDRAPRATASAAHLPDDAPGRGPRRDRLVRGDVRRHQQHPLQSPAPRARGAPARGARGAAG